MRLRSRITTPGFWSDSDLVEWPRDQRFTYHGLWMIADDAGCLEFSPRVVKGTLWPMDEDITSATLQGWIEDFIRAGKVVLYEADGKTCLFLRNFHKYQKLKNPMPPDVPLPPWLTFAHYQSNERMGKYELDSEVLQAYQDAFTQFLQSSYESLTDFLQSSYILLLREPKPIPKRKEPKPSSRAGARATGKRTAPPPAPEPEAQAGEKKSGRGKAGRQAGEKPITLRDGQVPYNGRAIEASAAPLEHLRYLVEHAENDTLRETCRREVARREHAHGGAGGMTPAGSLAAAVVGGAPVVPSCGGEEGRSVRELLAGQLRRFPELDALGLEQLERNVCHLAGVAHPDQVPAALRVGHVAQTVAAARRLVSEGGQG